MASYIRSEKITFLLRNLENLTNNTYTAQRLTLYNILYQENLCIVFMLQQFYVCEVLKSCAWLRVQ